MSPPRYPALPRRLGVAPCPYQGIVLPVFLLQEKLFKYKYPEKTLKVICKSPKYTGLEWIELSELKKIRKGKK